MRNQHYGRRRLANMDMTPDETHYERPADALPNHDDIIDICDGIQLYMQTWEVRHLVVWFVIEQLHSPTTADDPITVARIDCCWGMVHEHRYNRAGDDVLDHRKICDIPLDAEPDFVNTAYTDALKYAIDLSKSNLEWWRRS